SFIVEMGILAVKKSLVGYMLRRVGEAVVTLWLIASLTLLLLRILPGGPFDEEKALPPDIKTAIEAKYKLNDPLLKQYGVYLQGLVTGDLGESYKYTGRNVADIISESLPASVQLGVYA